MQIPYNIKIVLSENDKRILVIIFLVFLLLVLLIGILTKVIKKEEKKEGLKLDKYVNGYIKYGFIKTEKEFKKLCKKKNDLLLLKQLSLPLIIFIIAFATLGIFCSVTKQDMSYIWPIYNDMLIKIEVEETTAFGFLKVWASMPHFADNSFIFHSSTEAIISYIFLFLFIIGVILYIIAIFKYIAREKRILQKAKSIFDIKLEEDTN